MGRKRKFHTAALKSQGALEVVRGENTTCELAVLHGVHPTLINTWKEQFVDNAEELFQRGAKGSSSEHEGLQSQLYEQIGRLKTELD